MFIILTQAFLLSCNNEKFAKCLPWLNPLGYIRLV